MPGQDDVTPESASVSHTTATSANGAGETPKGRAAPANNIPELQEVDEFGLPIRKARRRIVEEDKSEDEALKDDEMEGGEVKKVEQAEESTEKVIAEEAQAKISLEEKSHDTPAPSNGEHKAAELKAQSPDGEEPRSRQHSVEAPRQSPSPEPRSRAQSQSVKLSEFEDTLEGQHAAPVSEWSHQQLAPHVGKPDVAKEEEKWQEMPAYAPFDIYDDDNKLVAREAEESDDEAAVYGNLGGAGKGYTRVQLDEDAKSVTSMDDNTAYLFKDSGNDVVDDDDDDEESRDVLSQMQATKNLLTEGQRIAYVGLVRLTMMEMLKELDSLERTKPVKKTLDIAVESMKMWSQKMMVRLYSHMEIDPAEQIMIEQLAEHGVQPGDLTPALMQNSRVKNPVAETTASGRASISSPSPDSPSIKSASSSSLPSIPKPEGSAAIEPPSEYRERDEEELPEVRTPSQLPNTKSLDIDLRWTVLCDLFLVLIADSVYDARSRQLLEKSGSSMDVPWLDICRFEKRVTDALEMQEAAAKETWNEEDHMQNRKKMARNRRLVMMGLATVGGSLVIGLSAGLLAPVIGAGLAAGFTTIGVAGTGGFLAGAGGAAIITTTGVVTGGSIAVRASDRRTGAVKTFEYRPLHNNKRVNLIVTISGWMNGKIDDVRLPYSTVDPIMGDIYSVYWEPEMLQSMGDTINILATEALTQGLQQVLGSTILIALMSAIQLPIVLTKLAYLIDNPWTVSLARADLAGLILADSLIDRNLGVRPITLVGFSLGSRVILSCLKELASKGATGLIQNVYVFGSPMVAKKDEYLRAKSVVAGRFVNGYATNDWILGYLFRATGGGIMRVAGLAAVEIPGIENVDVTEFVPGHMAYRAAMPRLLREVGWQVESDEFTEIEDPDPDNHEKRQRQLINEIEEARKELEKKPEKRRFGLFRNKKKAEKKEWETYDERLKQPVDGGNKSEVDNKTGGVLFDVDAIRAEAAELATQGIEIKQLESTLPPMKLDLSSSALSDPRSTLRETRSFNDSLPSTSQSSKSSSVPAPPAPNGIKENSTPRRGWWIDDQHDAMPARHAAASPTNPTNTMNGEDTPIEMTFEPAAFTQPAPLPAPSFPTRSSPSPSRSPALLSRNASNPNLAAPSPLLSASAAPPRPALRSSLTMPVALNLEHNAWAYADADADEDEFAEGDMKMTFE